MMRVLIDTGMDGIVTRNTDDDTASPIPVLTPSQLLARLTAPMQGADCDRGMLGERGFVGDGRRAC